MNKNKILYVFIVILTIGLIVCAYSLFREKQKKNMTAEITQLLFTLTEDVYTQIDKRLKNYDFLYPSIMGRVDSFRIYSEYEPKYRSNQFIDFYARHTDLGFNAKKQLYTLVNTISNTNSEDFKL